MNDISYYEKLGSLTVWENTAFEEDNSIFYPIEQGQDGMRYSLVIWGDGTFTYLKVYDRLLKHLTSHGFVVLGPNGRNNRNGDTMITIMDLLISKIYDTLSQFYQKLDVDNICAMGHSQRSGRTLILGDNEKVAFIVPIQLWV